LNAAFKGVLITGPNRTAAARGIFVTGICAGRPARKFSSKHRLLSAFVPLALFSSVVPGRHALAHPDPDDGAIDLPPRLPRPRRRRQPHHRPPARPLRFLTVAPNGDIYVKSTANGMSSRFTGSWNRAPLPQAGYRVEFIPFDAHGRPTDAYEDFATGFPGVENLANPNRCALPPERRRRRTDGSLYVCETQKGRVWRIIYTGDLTPKAAWRATVAAPAQNFPAIGARHARRKKSMCKSAPPATCPWQRRARHAAGAHRQQSRRRRRAPDRRLAPGPSRRAAANREKIPERDAAFGAAYNDTDLASVINYIRKISPPAHPK